MEKELIIVNIDPINKGPYILESLKIDKNLNKIDALNDIYKVLRPGEAPSIEIAEEIFNNLYFKSNCLMDVLLLRLIFLPFNCIFAIFQLFLIIN